MKQSAAGSQRDRDTMAPSISGALRYVLVTPARNEEAFIERTIQSVIRQTRPPLRWIIASDGSTDATDDIVRSYARDHPWIDLLRLEGGNGRSFARKALAFNEAYGTMQDYDFGGHPLWQLARGLYQSTSRPYVIGSVALLSGYAYQSLTRAPRPISRDLLRFHRAEQMRRLKGAAVRLLPLRARP